MTHPAAPAQTSLHSFRTEHATRRTTRTLLFGLVVLFSQAAAAQISIAPGSLTFAAQTTGTASPSQTVTVTNGTAGASAIALSSGNDVSFEVANTNCANPVAAGGTCTADIIFRPHGVAGAKNGTLTASIGAQNAQIPLSGTATASGAVVSHAPRQMDFGSLPVGSVSASQPLQIFNTGTNTLVITSITSDQPAFVFDQTQPLASGYCGLGGSGTEGVIAIAPSQGCTLNMACLAPAGGVLINTLTINSNAPGSPHTTTLRCTGVATFTESQNFYVTNTFGASVAAINSPLRLTFQLSSGSSSTESGLNFTHALPAGMAVAPAPNAANTCGGTFAPAAGATTLSLTGASLAASGGCELLVDVVAATPGQYHDVALAGTFGNASGFNPYSYTTTLTVRDTLPAISVANIDFGIWGAQQGNTWPHPVTLTNTGTDSLTIDSLNASGPFEIRDEDGNTCRNATLAPGASCVYRVRWINNNPFDETLQGGVFIGGNDISYTQSLQAVARSPVPFVRQYGILTGTRIIGSTNTQVVELINNSGVSQPISNISVAGDSAFQVMSHDCPSSMPHNTTCSINVRFIPTRLGAHEGALRVHGLEVLNLELSQSGLNPEGLYPRVTNFDFGKVTVSASLTRGISFDNSSAGPITVTGAIVGGNSQFTLTNNYCTTVAPGGSCSVELGFDPTAVGTASAMLTVTHNGPGGSFTVALTGVGVQALVAAPGAIDFGSVTAGTVSAPRTSVFTLVTNDCLYSNGIPTISGTDAGQFSIAATTCPGSGQTLNGSCYVVATFQPTGIAGPRNAVLNMEGTAGFCPGIAPPPGGENSVSARANAGNAIDASGTNDRQTISAIGVSVFTNRNASTSKSGAEQRVTLARTAPALRSIATAGTANAPVTLTGTVVTGAPPTVTFAPQSISFGIIAIGSTSAATIFAVTNNSGSTSSAGNVSVTFSGTHAAQFSITTNTCSAGGTANGGTCLVSVAFSPSSSGSKSASLNVTINGTSGTAALTGTGAATFTLAPVSLFFPDTAVGATSAVINTTFTNTASGNLTVSGISLNNSSFTRSGGTCVIGQTVATGGSCTIGIQFQASSAGNYEGVLSLVTAEGASGNAVSLFANAVEPVFSVNLSASNFGSQAIGLPSTARNVIVTNTGSATLTFTTTPVLSGNTADFPITNGCGASLAPGVSCTVQVVFNPTTNGARAATLTFTTNAAGSPHTVMLSGTGFTFTPPAANIMVSLGGAHMVAQKIDGTVVAWGSNDHGQLGDGSNTNRFTPVLLPGLTNVIAVSAGDSHTLALKSDGTVWSWGRNPFGQLGNGSTTTTNAPAQVPNLSGIVAIAGGYDHSYALRADGRIFAWGDNTYSQLGDGSGASLRLTPVQVQGVTDAVAIASGDFHGLALRADGSVVAWGWNAAGQVGDGTSSPRNQAVSTGLTGIARIAAGGWHSMAISTVATGGGVSVWGRNNTGQLGNGSNGNIASPITIAALAGSLTVDGGYGHALSVNADNSVSAWGLNDNGNLGNGGVINTNTPATVNGVSNVIQVAGGTIMSAAVLADGRVMAWGNGSTGALGDGSNALRSSAGLVAGVGGIGTLNLLDITSAPALVSVKSRKTHGGSGNFDLDIDTLQPISGAVTVESRIGPHLLVFDFNRVIATVGTVSVLDAAMQAAGTGTAIVNGSRVEVTLAGVADNRRVIVTIANVDGSGQSATASIGFLVGDINNSRSVNATDIAGIKARSGQTTSASNFKFDLNASGGINATDIAAVKARSGLVLP
jgi:alpha-tubulin suppressor-like RCC1 family protein